MGDDVVLDKSKKVSSTIADNKDDFEISDGGHDAEMEQRIAQELLFLSSQHSMEERRAHNKGRNKLQPRHALEFQSQDGLFDQFARAVCQAGVIPRKELFETWAMALYVHHYFPTVTRTADLACSHGLLSWALLLLSTQGNVNNNNNNLEMPDTSATSSNPHDTNSQAQHLDANNNNQSKRSPSQSLVCIDIHMPKSAERIAAIMLEHWPAFKEYWDFVEGPVEAVEPDSSTLLVGIHACGMLSDKIIQLAMEGNTPLALVPCCHSKKCLSADQSREFLQVLDHNEKAKDDISPTLKKNDLENIHGTMDPINLADFIDSYRIQLLKDAGFHVREVFIPKVFTPKNRILIATPPPANTQDTKSNSANHTKIGEKRQRLSLTTKGQPHWGEPKFTIPLADTEMARQEVQLLAGRVASNLRKKTPPISLCLSLFLPLHLVKMTAGDLQAIVDATIITHQPPSTTTTVTTSLPPQVEAILDDAFWHEESKQYARTFRIYYPGCRTRVQAQEYHRSIRSAIPNSLPGVVVRY